MLGGAQIEVLNVVILTTNCCQLLQHKKDVHYQNTLQDLVDPMKNDVQLSHTDYQRFKKHTPSYTSDVPSTGVSPRENKVTYSQ